MEELRLHGLIGGAASEKNFLMKYGGSDVINDLKGNPIQVAVGDYVYNEFNYTKLEGASVSVAADRTSPVQVAATAHFLEGNGGRKLVRLDSGRLISIELNTSVTYRRLQLQKSDDKGATWQDLCNVETTDYISNSQGFAIATDGVNVGIAFYMSGIRFIKINGNTQTNVNVYSSNVLITNTTVSTSSGISLAIDLDGVWHVAWSDYISTFPNSANVRYSKSANGVNWDAPTQLINDNISGYNNNNPCVVIMANGYPIVFWQGNYTSNNNVIFAKYFNGTTWNLSGVFYGGSSYSQAMPSATVGADGTIHVVWHGLDATDNSYNNIRYSKSTNNGATWSTPEKLTTGNSYTQFRASIACDSNNVVHVVWSGITATSSNNYNIRMIKGTSGSWGAIEQVTNQNTANVWNASVCENYRTFEKPLMIWTNGSTDIKFYGKWTDIITEKQIIPPMSLATNKSQLQALYANTLKMHNPKTDARFQGFVSKKDLWTTALQELDWVAASVSRTKNLFGLRGASADKLFATGSFAWSTTTAPSTYSQNITGLTFVPQLIVVLPYGEGQSNNGGNHAIYTRGIIGSEDRAHTGAAGLGGQTYPSIASVTDSGFTINIQGSSGYALNGTARWFAIG